MAKRCPDCGAYLDPGERCDCEHLADKPSEARAVCPLFKCRMDVGDKHYIVCMRGDGVVAGRTLHEDKAARDLYYLTLCCGRPEGCRIHGLSGQVSTEAARGREREKDRAERMDGLYRLMTEED